VVWVRTSTLGDHCRHGYNNKHVVKGIGNDSGHFCTLRNEKKTLTVRWKWTVVTHGTVWCLGDQKWSFTFVKAEHWMKLASAALCSAVSGSLFSCLATSWLIQLCDMHNSVQPLWFKTIICCCSIHHPNLSFWYDTYWLHQMKSPLYWE